MHLSTNSSTQRRDRN